MTGDCSPNKPFSTYNNPKVRTYDDLSKRIALTLGFPVLDLEVHADQVYENIAIALEFFTKYAGKEEIFLVFHTSLYERHRGVYLPDLFTDSVGVNTVSNVEDVDDNSYIIQCKKGNLTLIDSFSVSNSAHPVEYTLKFVDLYNGRAQTTKLLTATTYSLSNQSNDYVVLGEGNTYSQSQIGYSFNIASEKVELKAISNFTGYVEVIKSTFYSTSADSQIFNLFTTSSPFTSGSPQLIEFLINDGQPKPVEYLCEFTTQNLTGGYSADVKQYLVAYKTQSNSFSVSSQLIGSITSDNTEYFQLSAVSTTGGIGIYCIPLSTVRPNTGILRVAKNTIYPTGNTENNRITVTTVSGTEKSLDTFDITSKNDSPYEYTFEFVDLSGNRDVRKWVIAAVGNSTVASVSGSQIGKIQTNSINFGSIYPIINGSNCTMTLSTQSDGTAYIYKNTKQPQRTLSEDLGIDTTTGDTRRVSEVYSFEEGTSDSVNTLFTLEQSLAQQTYFSYALGNYGFDMISWHLVKQYLNTRQKIFATRQYFDFNPRTQYLRIIPEPDENKRYYALIGCWVEKPLSELLKEQWVYQYALALTKISLARIRGKYQSVTLFGGGTISFNDLLSEGLQEKKDLEEKMLTGASAGFGDSEPPCWFIG